MMTIPTQHGWQQDDQWLQRTIQFPSFRHAISFVNAVAEVAEQHNHHPDITINYRSVTLRLTTHDAGGLTDKDFSLAAAINEIPV